MSLKARIASLIEAQGPMSLAPAIRWAVAAISSPAPR
jgi:hypothetical protein